MTKQEILEYFKEINHAYNESTRLDDLSRMLDELMQSNSDGDAISRADAIKALEYELSIEADGGLDKYRTVIKDLLNAIYNTQKKAIEALPSIQPKIQMVQNPCVECGCNYCTNDDCDNRYIVDIAKSEVTK